MAPCFGFGCRLKVAGWSAGRFSNQPLSIFNRQPIFSSAPLCRSGPFPAKENLPGLRSRAFPGLWLDPHALLTGDGAKVMAKPQEGLPSAEHATLAAELQKRIKV